MVVLDHHFGIVTKYGHLSRIAVSAGDEVSRGDVIGYVGSTGRSTGAHLHYEVWMNGRLTNPMTLLAK
jgi:murein DD-endopeptidase MepM/ murein hydrolase activator NlpD